VKNRVSVLLDEGQARLDKQSKRLAQFSAMEGVLVTHPPCCAGDPS
jgi:hypothetical protein